MISCDDSECDAGPFDSVRDYFEHLSDVHGSPEQLEFLTEWEQQ